MAGKCPICGETDPLPASFCLAKLTGAAERDVPCQYSVEGGARLRAAMIAQSERCFRGIKEDRAARTALTPEAGQAEGGEHA